jgi:hypothetical protein
MIQILQTSSELVVDQVKVVLVDDAFTVGLRGSYRLRPGLTGALRAEYTANTMPEQFTSPVSLDFDKVNLQAGLHWQMTSWLGAVVEYTQTILVPRSVEKSAFGPRADPRTPVDVGLDKPRPHGRYTGYAVKVTAGLTVAFN